MTRNINGFVMLVILVMVSVHVVQAADSHGHSPVMIYKTEGDLEEIKEDIELAITDRGLLVSGNLHVSDMLQRTAKDLGFAQPVYKKALSIEFCSAYISHLIVSTNPANLVICPFTIAVYVLEAEPESVYVAFQKPHLAGDAEEAKREIMELMDSIVQEVIG